MNGTATKNATAPAPRAVFMMGGPGSGKSYIRNRDYAGLRVLDCDRHKAGRPDYNPKNPNALHAWSRIQLAREFAAAVGAGESFVYDGTGARAERYARLMAVAREAGYAVELCYVRCPLRIALKRNATRARTVPESIVRSRHADVGVAFELIAGAADGTRIVNNG